MVNQAMDDSSSIHSGTSAWSHIAGPSTKPDSARITIQLENGKRFIVFVPQNSTMGDLHAAALKRAENFGFKSTIQDSDLQTTGNKPLSMFPNDTLQDMIGETEDNTFKLCNMDSESGPASPHITLAFREKQEDDVKEPLVYIRWITLEDALLNAQITSIKVDHSPLLQSTTLGKLYHTAVEKFLGVRTGVANNKLNLYLKDCYLVAECNSATFDDLGLQGSRDHPLDVFVDIVPATVSITVADLKEGTDLSTLWGFDTTIRGVCTLTSCLEILKRELSAKSAGMQEFSQVLFEVSHFPPMILAFARLFECDWKNGKEAASLRMFAYAMQQLCSQMVPLSSCKSSLEGSRQVLAWLKMTVPSESLLMNDTKKLVNKIIIVEKKETETQTASALLPYHHEVSLVGPSDQSSSTPQKVLVGMDRQDDRIAHYLAHAFTKSLCGIPQSFLDFFGNWTKLIYHKKSLAPMPSEFDALLQSANSPAAGKLKIVGPLQLGNIAANALPVLTLGSTGFVSIYDQEDYACSEKRFFTWNASQKKEVMAHADPGQQLIQKLESIISERKTSGTFEVDAWSDWVASAHFGEPNEAIVFCIDTSGSMAVEMPPSWSAQGNQGSSPSRLTEVKEQFKNIAVRISALKLSAHLGLVTFSATHEIAVRQKLTGIHLDFESQVERIQPQTQTAIFNGIEKAREMLTDLSAQYPNCRLRIVVLTDGDENYLTRRLSTQNIVLDSIVIGTNATNELFKMSRATGGYAFASKTQEAFFQICVLETMVDVSRRPDIVKVPFIPWFHFLPKAADMRTLCDIPPCKPHPHQNDEFIALGDAELYWRRRTVLDQSQASHAVLTESSIRKVSAARSSTTGMGNLKAILLEIQATMTNAHEDMDVYISESDLSFWLVVMQSPTSSPYEAGTFLCYLDLSEYPSKPPAARFLTQVLHPNITKHGKICHPIFDREYTPHTRVYEMLQHIWGLFMSLEARDAVDPLSTLKHWTNPTQAQEEIREHVSRFASLSREDHRTKFLRNDAADVKTELVGASAENSGTFRDSKRMKF